MEDVFQDFITFARQLSESGCYSKALDFYVMAFEKNSELKVIHEPEFRALLTRQNEILASTNNVQDLFNNFSRAFNLYPESACYINDTGKYLYKFGYLMEAWNHFQKALRLDYSNVNAEKNLNSVKNVLVERWHFRMLNDKIRNEAYRAAINQTVIPSKDKVLDIGTGTGLLALYASEASPLSVIACDGSEVMAKLAQYVIKENNNKQIVIINSMSSAMHHNDLGGKQSLVLTEMFDAGLFGEHVLMFLSHAWDNLISTEGRVIPNKAEFFVIGAKCDFMNKKYQLSSSAKASLNVPSMYVHILTEEETYDCEDVHLYGDDIEYLTEAQSLVKVDFNNVEEMQEMLNRTEPYEVEFKALKDGEINTVIGWFNLYLTDDITITTDPRSESRCNAWQQAVFFDYIPKEVKENELTNLKFVLNSDKLTLVPDDRSITRISPETLMFLNDAEYMNMILGCMGLVCVYLGQMTEMSQMNVVDLCPFPMFGLQMMKRGAQSLICHAKTENDRVFFEEVFKTYDIDMSMITVLIGDDWSQDVFKDEKYHAIFHNIFDTCGDINVHYREVAENLKSNHLVQGGLFLPANIKPLGQLIYSHWVDINNRLFDENVSGYKIARFLNRYQVTQNFCMDFAHLEYTAMTKPCLLSLSSGAHRSEVVHVPVIQNGYANALICWFSIQIMEGMNELSTNRKNAFIEGTLFMGYSRIHLVRGEVARILRYVDPDGSFKVVLDNMDAT